MSDFIAVGPSPSNLTEVDPTPASCIWGLQDVSSPDAGRVHDANNTMYKMRTSQKRKLQLTWTFLSAEEVSRILKAFNAEYFYVRFLDAMEGRLLTRQFYAGDRTAPVKWYKLPRRGTLFATLSFDIIER